MSQRTLRWLLGSWWTMAQLTSASGDLEIARRRTRNDARGHMRVRLADLRGGAPRPGDPLLQVEAPRELGAVAVHLVEHGASPSTWPNSATSRR
ncbi:hypothetical protein BE21_18410 [Sorangium cellulosum]|uniref:Uncharacterized protein n=1 Tax=Sorangium cellulosum TaxID=56 RepID=A0A150TXI9_SORCE|nr:hypothetical protein BE21_18410 [Sorangium cellulosum]